MKFFSENLNIVNNLIAEFLIGKTKKEYDFYFSELIEDYEYLKEYAQKGESYWYNVYLRSVIKISDYLHINLSDKLSSITLIEQSKSDIKKKSNKRLQKELKTAREYAEEGDNYMMNLCIKDALKLALELGINIDSQIEEIKSYMTSDNEKKYLNIKLQEELKIAREKAKEGDSNAMNLYIAGALRYALKLDIDIDIDIEEIENYITPDNENNYLNKELEKELEGARENAEEGNSYMMELHIKDALEIALKLDKNIEIEIEKIKNLLL